MEALFYLRLIGFSAGAIAYLFLMALILGHRRPRFFERLLFFLALALFLVYSGGLLALNARIHYATPPEATQVSSELLIALGMAFLPALLAHVPLQYYRQLRPSEVRWWWRIPIYVLYATPVAYILVALLALPAFSPFPFRSLLALVRPGDFKILAAAVLLCAGVDFGVVRASKDATERWLFQGFLVTCTVIFAAWVLWQGFASIHPMAAEAMMTVMVFSGVLPGSLLIYYALQRNFLEFGAQRNLVYALSATFLALLYLALVRRVSGWLEPVFPPEGTAAILLFVLVFLFEPLERVIGPALHRMFRERMNRLQRLTAELQQEARRGDLESLVACAERRIHEEFSLAGVRLSVPPDRARRLLESPGGLGHTALIPLRKNGQEIGIIEVVSTGAYLTGETTAALEFLAEQFPAMVDLCRLIGEKLTLERGLAERERLALLGQMAASISHNLRNPLSSIKMILQSLLEEKDLPERIRKDATLVVAEINRMGDTLGKLLRYAKPSVRPGELHERVAAGALAGEIVALLAWDAERKRTTLSLVRPPEEVFVLGSAEALNDILSNLLVNAIEAQTANGRIEVTLAPARGRLIVDITDDGPGIPAEFQERIFQPFFTTKAQGTGLGLAIVARRLEELGGSIEWKSPVKEGRGAAFRVSLPLTEQQAASAQGDV